MSVEDVRILVLASGEASTAEEAIKKVQNTKTWLPFVGFFTSRPEKLKRDVTTTFLDHQVPSYFYDRRDYSKEEFYKYVSTAISDVDPNVIAQLGWTLKTPNRFIDRFSTLETLIFNQHPADLDPDAEYFKPEGYNDDPEKLDFGGKGMHGRAPIAARIAYNWITGATDIECTLHITTKDYDDGALIGRQSMDTPVTPTWFLRKGQNIDELRENPRDLIEATKEVKDRLPPIEHQNVIATIEQLVTFGVTVFKSTATERNKRTERLVPKGCEQILFDAKHLARTLFPNG